MDHAAKSGPDGRGIPALKPERRRLLREWRLVAISVSCIALVLGGGSYTWRLDQALYDAGLALIERPADERIVIVAVDDESVTALGRWPWGRRVHAALLDRIAKAKPQAVGVDIGFTEPDRSDEQGDRELAEVFARVPGLVLPVLSDGTNESLPLEAFRRTARLAHVNIRLDLDGIVRSVELQRTAPGGKRDYLARAMLAQRGRIVDSVSHLEKLEIAFAGPPGRYQRISAARIVRGEVGASEMAGKFVLIGVTATGLGDKHATPSTVSGGPMPGVEIIANVLDNLLSGKHMVRAPAWFV